MNDEPETPAAEAAAAAEPEAEDPAADVAAEPAAGAGSRFARRLPPPLATGYTRTREFVAVQPRRRLIAVPVLVLALLAAAVTAIAWPDYPLGPGVTVDADRDADLIEDLPTEERLPESGKDETDATEIPATDAEPKWRYPNAKDSNGELVRIDGGYVYDGRVGFDSHGKRTWKSGGGGSVATGGTVIIAASDIEGDDSWPGKDKTTVTDAKTGEKLWSDSTASFSSAWHDQVYLSRCQGGQDGELGECVVTAHDAHSGATRWSRPTYASTSVVEAAPDGSFVVFKSHVTSGADVRYTVVDTATGAVLSGGFDKEGYGGNRLLVIDDLVIAVGEDDNPADDCRLPAKATNVRTGAEVWDRKLGVDIEEGGDYCGNLDDRHGEYLTAYDADRKPVVVNLRTGKTVWTAPAKGVPKFGDGEYAMVRDPDGALLFYDIDADEELWRLPEGVPMGGLVVGDDHVYVETADYVVEDDCWIRVRLKSGDADRYPGMCAGSGTDWLASVSEGDGLKVYRLG